MDNNSYRSIEEWVAGEGIGFSMNSVDGVVDRVMEVLGGRVRLLGLGEGLHGGEEILILRNRMFQRLVERHGFSAIALESSFTRGRVVDEYVAGGPGSYEDVGGRGFSHGFGKVEANRELVEWMRAYNATHEMKVRFYGVDSPTEMYGTDGPRGCVEFVLDYLDDRERRATIEGLLGQDAAWENPAALMDPTKSIGGSEAAVRLRVEVEDLISELGWRRPELVQRTGRDQYLEALQYAIVARQLLNYHAGLARASERRMVELLGIRDLMMGENLVYAVNREHGRGKVFAFAHNMHLQRGKARWELGAQGLEWWPAGAHVDLVLADRYAVVGSGVGVSEQNGIVRPEAATLEAAMMGSWGRVVMTDRGAGVPVKDLAKRSGSRRNPSYFPLSGRSLTDFDALVVLDEVTYTRGGIPLR